MNKRRIFLAGSTFWGGQSFIDNLPGVIDTELGVTDGGNDEITENNWIAKVDSASLGTSECIRIDYDADVIPLALLLQAFFETVDPFSTVKPINYSGGMPEAKILFEDADDEIVAAKAVAELQAKFEQPVTIEVIPLEGFREAGTYAQDYIARNFGEDCVIPDPEAAAEEFVAAHKDQFGK